MQFLDVYIESIPFYFHSIFVTDNTFFGAPFHMYIMGWHMDEDTYTNGKFIL